MISDCGINKLNYYRSNKTSLYLAKHSLGDTGLYLSFHSETDRGIGPKGFCSVLFLFHYASLLVKSPQKAFRKGEELLPKPRLAASTQISSVADTVCTLL